MANEEVDVVVVGAGFGGIHHVFRARQEGLTVVALERWSGFGGTWHKPNYPGAHCDTDCNDYCFSFDEQLQESWKWPNRYATGDELEEYISHTAEKHNLRQYFRFNEEVVGAKFIEETNRWEVKTRKGSLYCGQFLVLAIGCLSIPLIPSFAKEHAGPMGRPLSNKKEESDQKMPLVFHSSQFSQDVPVGGKKVVIVGTGSTAQQASPEIAKVASKVSVLQRTPNYSIPNGYTTNYKQPKDWKTFRKEAITTSFGFNEGANPSNPKKATEMTKEECLAELERRWAIGGFQWLGCFSDLLLNPETNMMVAEFVNNKTRQLVKDPVTAELLCPDYHYGCKRPSMSMNTDWWEHFNRDHVELVCVKQDPIEQIVKEGVLLESGRIIEADVIVLCTGYDAMTGAFFHINPIGRDGLELKSAWESGAHSYLGMATVGFPNFFWIGGPQTASSLASFVQAAEVGSDWILKAIQRTKQIEKKKYIEVKPQAQSGWSGMTGILGGSVLLGRPECGSWYLGLNIPGKAQAFNIFLSWNQWHAKAKAEEEGGFQSFVFGDEKTDLDSVKLKPSLLHPSVQNWLAGIAELTKDQPPPPITPEGQRGRFLGMVATLGQGGNVGKPTDYQVNENVPVRVYNPPIKKRMEDGLVPCLVWYHGGGFVVGDHTVTHAALARDFCSDLGVVVVVVGYRLAPENPFPAAYNDSVAAYEWVVENSELLKIDPSRIVVSGDSAGGNLACGVCLNMIKKRKDGKTINKPVSAGLFYPYLTVHTNTLPSREKFADTPMLKKDSLRWFENQYLFGGNSAPSEEDLKVKDDPRASPLLVDSTELEGYPVTFIRTAEVDPLSDDGKVFSERLQSVGVDVDMGQVNGVLHPFILLRDRWAPAGVAYKEFLDFFRKTTMN